MFSQFVSFLSAIALTFAPIAPSAHVGPSPGAAVSITGRVTDAASRRLLQGAQVQIVGHSVGAVTSASGHYIIPLDDSWIGQEVTMSVTLLAYTTAQTTATLTQGVNTMDFEMREQALALEGVVVTAVAGQARRSDARMAGEREAVTMAPSVMYQRVQQVALGGRYTDDFNTESYARIDENEWRGVDSNPLSTFSIDVDRASYSNVRRFIRDGVRPPIDAVRIEELINYFTYSDPEPEGDVPFSVTTEVAAAPWQPEHLLARIGLKGRSIDMSDAPANNLVFLLDVSGSMNSPDKLPLLKTAFGMLVEQLRAQDQVAIVVYAGAAGLVLPSTSGSDRQAIEDALEGLQSGGSTAGGAGIRLAYSVAAENHIEGGNNRVILATDGDFNVGASSDADMVRLIEDKREQGTFLTVLGFGTGNLQDAKMEQIADHGNGNFAYIDSELEAKKVLVNEMGGTLVTIAQDVKIQVEFNPARVLAYRLIGYENRMLAAEDFEDDTKDAGELGAGHSVTALYEIVPIGADSPVAVRDIDDLRYQRNDAPEQSDSNEIMFVKLRYQQPGGSPSQLVTRPVGDIEADDETSVDFRFAAAVAAWGMLLRDSEHCAGFSLNDVASLARAATGDDAEGYRAEFLTLIDRARSLELLALEPGAR